MVRTRRVLAVPGRPVIRQWPPTNRPIMICSRTSSWPTMTRRTCVTISDCTWRKRSMRAFKTSGSSCDVTDVDMMDPFLLFLFRCRIARSSNVFRGVQFQQELLRGPVSGRRFQRRYQFVLGLGGLVVQVERARRLVMRLGGVDGIVRHHGADLANRSRHVPLVEPQSSQRAMLIVIQRVNIIQALQDCRGFLLVAD